MKAELSVGLLPNNKNIYIVASDGKELIINSGVKLMAIDANGEKHSIGCTLSADYFFRLITNALDEEHKKHKISSIFSPAWGIGSEFSSENLEKKDKEIWDEFMKKINK